MDKIIDIENKNEVLLKLLQRGCAKGELVSVQDEIFTEALMKLINLYKNDLSIYLVVEHKEAALGVSQTPYVLNVNRKSAGGSACFSVPLHCFLSILEGVE